MAAARERARDTGGLNTHNTHVFGSCLHFWATMSVRHWVVTPKQNLVDFLYAT